ncbi:hypothetical protein X801_06085 [Opisthorchis viverrini]|uniref:Prolyl 4-hydroxylase alpha subunit domain-containing protein n=2 Tax=Opisthorchis viverrini TaxID=6198 RepID=A0A1S8WUF6_OPIVI|nr:hypothetical protein X801_06085 [Opisthorchis viverrini]
MTDGTYPFEINLRYNTPSFVDLFRSAYQSNDISDFLQDGCKLLKLPFSCAAFENFLQPNSSGSSATNSDGCFASEYELINRAESEARRLPFERKCNDMFTFSQSVDVVNLSCSRSTEAESQSLFLVQLRSFLLSNVIPWLEQLTGAPLEKEVVDFTSSIYSTNDVLLCHDDQLEKRRIAFVWYLVPDDWDEQTEGGCLDLFSCQPDQQLHVPVVAEKPTVPINPWKITASLPPRRNMLVFFEPSAYSFHQVAENLGVRDRLSLHGWFHGPPHPRPTDRDHPTPIPLVSPVHVEILRPYTPSDPKSLQPTSFCNAKHTLSLTSISVQEELVYRWISPIYLDMKQQSKIRRRFIKSSEIQLMNFLRKEFNEPSAKRSHLENGESCSSSTPESELARPSDPQFRRWTIGSYTLLADSDVLDTSWRLESTLYLGGYGPVESDDDTEQLDGKGDSVNRWPTSWGGHTVYIADGEKEELLSVSPINNALTLVYAGPGTASFVKYINHSARPSPLFPQLSNNKQSTDDSPPSCYDLSVIYYEPVSTSESSSVSESSSEDAEDDEGDEEEEGRGEEPDERTPLEKRAVESGCSQLLEDPN